MPVLQLLSEQWPLWYWEGDPKRTSIDSHHHILSPSSLCTQLFCSILPQINPLCIPSTSFLCFVPWLHLLSQSQGHCSGNSAISLLHDDIFSLYWAFPSSCKHTIMSLIPKKSLPWPQFSLSFHPTFLPSLSQNSSKELSTLTVSSHLSSSTYFFTQLPEYYALWFSSYPIGHFVWGSFAILPSLPALLLWEGPRVQSLVPIPSVYTCSLVNSPASGLFSPSLLFSPLSSLFSLCPCTM